MCHFCVQAEAIDEFLNAVGFAAIREVKEGDILIIHCLNRVLDDIETELNRLSYPFKTERHPVLPMAVITVTMHDEQTFAFYVENQAIPAILH